MSIHPSVTNLSRIAKQGFKCVSYHWLRTESGCGSKQHFMASENFAEIAPFFNGVRSCPTRTEYNSGNTCSGDQRRVCPTAESLEDWFPFQMGGRCFAQRCYNRFCLRYLQGFANEPCHECSFESWVQFRLLIQDRLYFILDFTQALAWN